jgi:cellulose synthase operon protein C
MLTTHRLGLGLAGLLTLLLPLAAGADTPRYTHKVRDVKVVQTDLTKNQATKGKGTESKPDKTITADKYLQVEAAIQGDLDALIAVYAKALKSMPAGDGRRLDIAYRLAEAYAQKYRHHHSLSMEALNKRENSTKKVDKDKFDKEHKAQEAQKQSYLKNAISAYKAVVEDPDAKKLPKIDEVIFYYAFTLQQAGYADAAREVFKRLLKDHQGSRFVPDAYNAFADWYFENRDLPNAEAFYNKVMQFKQSPLYDYATWKRGWVYFNQARWEDAMKAFAATVLQTDGKKDKEVVHRAAKKDYVRAYSESTKKVELAPNEFKKLDPTDEGQFKLVAALADFYMEAGKSDKAIWTYHYMMKLKPKHAEICDWELNIVRATMMAGTPEDKVKELSNLVNLYTFLKGLKGKEAPPSGNLQDCHDNAAGITAELAMLWHAEGMKTLNQKTLDLAGMLYSVYLENFPDAENAPDIQYNVAELRWRAAELEKNEKEQPKRWEAAANEYCKVVDLKGVKPELVKEAALVCVLAWKNALAVDPTTDTPPPNNSKEVPKPQDIPVNEAKMMAAFDVYLKNVKDEKDEERTQILFFKCRIYWKRQHFAEAVPLCEEILTKTPDHAYAKFAMTVLLDSLNWLQREEDMLKWVARLLKDKKFIATHGSTQAYLAGLQLQGKRKLAESLEKKQNKFRECGDAYLEIFDGYPQADARDELLFNAAVCYERAKFIGRAVSARKRLIDEFPKSNLSKRALYMLGANYAQIAKYEEAATYYEQFATQYGGEKEAKDALNDAVFLRKGLGQDQAAIKNTEQYVKTFRNKDEKIAALANFSLITIFEKNKAWDQAITHLETYVNQWNKKGGLDRLIIAHAKAGELYWKYKSCATPLPDGSCVKVTRSRALKTDKRKQKGNTVQTQCGPDSKNKLTVIARGPQMSAKAKAHFKRAIDLWANGGAAANIAGKDEAEKNAKIAEVIYWVAAAQFYQGEALYEQFLTLEFPTKLDFNPDKPKVALASKARLEKWLAAKNAGVLNARKVFVPIVDWARQGGVNVSAAHWAIASAARMGQVYQNFSDALFTAEIPKELRSDQDSVDYFCDEMVNVADPLENESINAFGFCLEQTQKIGWFNEWSKLCEGELAQIRPIDFPAASELRAPSDKVPLTLDIQGFIDEIDDAAPAPATTAGGPAPAAKNP